MKHLLKFSLNLFLLSLILGSFTFDANAQFRRRKKKTPEPVKVVSDVVPQYSVAIGRQMVHDNINKEQKLYSMFCYDYNKFMNIECVNF